MNGERSKAALVLAGGGIMGAAYEIGALAALDRLFTRQFNANRFDMYVGVSAGSVIATLMANRISPHDLFAAVAQNSDYVFNWRRRDIYRLDMKELFASCFGLMRNLLRIFANYRRHHWGFSFVELMHILQEQFPAGLYSLHPLERYLHQAFRKEGVLDDFSLLERELYIPAYDLDRGERVVFGSEGYRNMPISKAIPASCAIPFFFRPYDINGIPYMDGSIGRPTHIDIAIERGAKLIVLINPRVPMRNEPERSCLPSLSFGKCSSIADLGILFAWEQAQRIENQEKLKLALDAYRHRYPEVDILVIEPGPEESMLFFQSPMSHEARQHVMNYGFHLTMLQLKENYADYRELFGRHGVEVSTEELPMGPPVELVV